MPGRNCASVIHTATVTLSTRYGTGPWIKALSSSSASISVAWNARSGPDSTTSGGVSRSHDGKGTSCDARRDSISMVWDRIMDDSSAILLYRAIMSRNDGVGQSAIHELNLTEKG